MIAAAVRRSVVSWYPRTSRRQRHGRRRPRRPGEKDCKTCFQRSFWSMFNREGSAPIWKCESRALSDLATTEESCSRCSPDGKFRWPVSHLRSPCRPALHPPVPYGLAIRISRPAGLAGPRRIAMVSQCFRSVALPQGRRLHIQRCAGPTSVGKRKGAKHPLPKRQRGVDHPR